VPAPGGTTFHASRAFLVRAVDVGEADRRLTFFTEREGVVTLLGKAAWKSRKRFGGALQRYFLLDVSWSARGARPPVIDHSAILESFWDLLPDWERVRHGDHLLEAAAALFPQPGPKPRAFHALHAGLRCLASGEDPLLVARRCEAVLLHTAGWGPNLSGCRACGREISRSFRFLPGDGGVACDGCTPGGGEPLSGGAVRTWRAFQGASPGEYGRIRASGAILSELGRILPAYLAWCTGRPLRSLATG
jgi:DNA repair protein RecO (recombination protein O)